MNEPMISRRRLMALAGVTVGGTLASRALAENPHSTTEFFETDDPDFFTFTMAGT